MTDASETPHPSNPADFGAGAVRVDARGLLCPLPLVKAARAFAGAPADRVIDLWSDDPSALVDVPEWCAARGHEVLGVRDEGAVLRFLLRKAADTAGPAG